MKQGVIFDLDGVIVSTDEYHYLAWMKMAKTEEIYFDREINERLRGVSRMESLEIILERSRKEYTQQEKEVLASIKNEYYKGMLTQLSDKHILPGVLKFLEELEERGIKKAIGSSSKNTDFILKQIGLKDRFDVIVDGNNIKNSKPDPEVFLLAAKLLDIAPENCVVIEDANAGIDAAKAAGTKAVAVGSAAVYKKADYATADIGMLDINEVLK